MTMIVAPSTFHTMKFISENPGCTAREFSDSFGYDLAWIRSPYHSNMLSADIEGSQPHPRSPLGRHIAWAQDVDRLRYPFHIPFPHELIERGRHRRNWIYRTKRDSKVYRYYLTNKALTIIDDLECERGPHRYWLRRDLIDAQYTS